MFLDVDGTLLEFAPTPEGVFVPATLIAVLETLATKLGGALAFVSGRRVEDLDRLFAPLRLPAAGVHGGEIRLAPAELSPIVALGDDLPRALFAAVDRDVRSFPGVFTEPKRFSLAVHYIDAPHLREVLRSQIEATLSHYNARDVEILQARFVIEVKVKGFNKGSAISTLLKTEPFRDRLPVFIGDDITDEDGFAAAREAGGRAYSVTEPRGRATYTFKNPEAVRDWLASLISGEALA